MEIGSRWFYLGTLLFGATFLALLWLLVAAGFGNASRGRTYVEAIAGQPNRVNPLFASQNDADSDLCALVFSGLTRIDVDGRAVSDLAESWVATADAKSFTFTLRRNAAWQDGARLRSDDVLFTVELLRQAAAAEEPGIPPFWKEVQAGTDGDYAVTLNFPTPFAQFPSYASVGILPRHLLEGLSLQEIKAAPFNRAPIGSGPYMLVQVDAEKAVLQPNPRSWAGTPHFDRVEFRYFANVQGQLAALQRHEAHAALLAGQRAADVRNLLGSDRSLTVMSLPRNETDVIFFNTSVAQLNDIDVRQALALAIDRDALTAIGATGVTPAMEFGAPSFWNEAGELRPVNVSKAQGLLDAAGWRLDDSGRRTRDGQPLRVVLTTTSEQDRVPRAQAIVERWRSIGIDARLEPLSPSLLVREALAPRRYDALFLSTSDPIEPDLFSSWHSSQTGPDARNISNFTDGTMDKVAEEARQQTDPEQRLTLYRRGAQLVQRHTPATPILHPTDVYVVDRRVQGVNTKVLFSTAGRFTNFAQWQFLRNRR